MKLLIRTTIATITSMLASFSTFATTYNDIVPITGSDVSLQFMVSFNMADLSPAHQFKTAPGIFMVPYGKKLILRSVGCETHTSENDNSIRMNEKVKIRIRLYGYRSSSQDHFGINPYGNVPIVDRYGSVPEVTNNLNYQNSAVIFESAFIKMQAEIYNANSFRVANGASVSDLDIHYLCTVKGNLYTM